MKIKTQLPNEPSLHSAHKKNLSMKINNPFTLEKGEKVLPQVVGSKRFPKEIFMPPINSHRKISTNEVMPLRPFGVERKKQPQCVLTGNPGLYSPRVQFIKTLISHDLNVNVDIPPLISSIISPTNVTSVKHRSNQTLNLEMAFRSKPSSIYPLNQQMGMENLIRAKSNTQGDSGGNVNEIKLKPIRRTIHSSRGDTIKISVSRNIITEDTRPNTKEDEVMTSSSFVKNILPTIKSSSFLDKVTALSRFDSRRNAEVSMKNNKEDIKGQEEICNITFGRNDFQKHISI